MRKAKAKEIMPKEIAPIPPPETVDVEGPVITVSGPFGEAILIVNTSVPSDDTEDKEDKA